MARKEKIGNPQGVEEWRNLASCGDVQRFLKWCIHSVRDQTMDPRTAATLGQLGCYSLKAIEGADLEVKIHTLEERIQKLQEQIKEARYENAPFRPR